MSKHNFIVKQLAVMIFFDTLSNKNKQYSKIAAGKEQAIFENIACTFPRAYWSWVYFVGGMHP